MRHAGVCIRASTSRMSSAADLICEARASTCDASPFASVTMAVASARDALMRSSAVQSGADRERETVFGRLADQNLDHFRKFLVERAFGPRVLAMREHALHRLLGERRRIVQELRAKEILERWRDEVRVELERETHEGLVISLQRRHGLFA